MVGDCHKEESVFSLLWRAARQQATDRNISYSVCSEEECKEMLALVLHTPKCDLIHPKWTDVACLKIETFLAIVGCGTGRSDVHVCARVDPTCQDSVKPVSG